MCGVSACVRASVRPCILTKFLFSVNHTLTCNYRTILQSYGYVTKPGKTVTIKRYATLLPQNIPFLRLSRYYFVDQHSHIQKKIQSGTCVFEQELGFDIHGLSIQINQSPQLTIACRLLRHFDWRMGPEF